MNTSTAPRLLYAHADGGDNTVRTTSLTYPNGRVLTYDYGSAGGTDDAMSRIASLIDDDMASTHLGDYAYLGTGTFVEVDYTDPEIKYTLVGTAGGCRGHFVRAAARRPHCCIWEASALQRRGDIYRGLDRFGRIKDSYWYNYGSLRHESARMNQRRARQRRAAHFTRASQQSPTGHRIEYGYDRDSNRVWRQNTVAPSSNFDELYAHDGINRLEDMERGTLNAGKTEINNPTFGQCWSLDAVGNWQHFRQEATEAADRIGRMKAEGGSSQHRGWDLVQSREANKVNEITGITETGPDPCGMEERKSGPSGFSRDQHETLVSPARESNSDSGRDTVESHN